MGLAKSKKLTLLTVESCTAGALACALAEAEGAGEVLHGGFVVYSKENKSFAVGVLVEGMLAEPWYLRGYQEVRLREFLTMV